MLGLADKQNSLFIHCTNSSHEYAEVAEEEPRVLVFLLRKDIKVVSKEMRTLTLIKTRM